MPFPSPTCVCICASAVSILHIFSKYILLTFCFVIFHFFTNSKLLYVSFNRLPLGSLPIWPISLSPHTAYHLFHSLQELNFLYHGPVLYCHIFSLKSAFTRACSILPSILNPFFCVWFVFIKNFLKINY